MAEGHLRPVPAGVTTLVDSNVLLDVIDLDEQWREWSERALTDARDDGELIINPLVYAEISVRFDKIEELDAVLADDYVWEPLPRPAAFLAGKAFLKYRRSGGRKLSPLPDFYIGAHATVRSYRLLTRDANRYRTYYPKLEIVAPEPHRASRTPQTQT